MSVDPTDLPAAVLRLADRLPEPFCDRFGREYMDAVDVFALASRLGFLAVPVPSTDDPAHVQIIGGTPTLFYRANLHPDALAHVLLDVIARHLCDTDYPERVGCAFAFVGTMGWDAVGRGASWITARWNSLRELSEPWYEQLLARFEEDVDVLRLCFADINDIRPTENAGRVGWTYDRMLQQARLARHRGALDRAAQWAAAALEHSESVPSRLADANNVLARCEYERGRIGAARERWLATANHAERHGLYWHAGWAHINLVSCAIVAADEDAVRRHTDSASRMFPRGSVELACLAQNYARHRINAGEYAPALTVLLALARMPDLDARCRVLVYAGLARCYAGIGRREGFDDAVCAALTIMELAPDTGSLAYLDLGEAALLLGEWDCAARMGVKALDSARARGAACETMQAQDLLAKVSRREGARAANDVSEVVQWVPAGDIAHTLAAALTFAA